MKSFLNPIVQLTACLVVAASLTVQAQETKADPSGTWTWTLQGRGGGGGGGGGGGEPRKISLTLKADGENLTGKLSSPGRQGGEPRVSEISEGKVKDGEISFKVSRQRQNVTFVQTYSGKINGDTITGTIAFERNGESQSREWIAKREPEKE